MQPNNETLQNIQSIMDKAIDKKEDESKLNRKQRRAVAKKQKMFADKTGRSWKIANSYLKDEDKTVGEILEK